MKYPRYHREMAVERLHRRRLAVEAMVNRVKRSPMAVDDSPIIAYLAEARRKMAAWIDQQIIKGAA